MYEDILATLDFFVKHEVGKFTSAFESTGREISTRDKEKIQTILIHDGLVEHDPDASFGREQSFAITIQGKHFFNTVSDFQYLDKILRYLDGMGDWFFAKIPAICEHQKIPFSQSYEYQLKNDGMIGRSLSKDWDGAWCITDAGRDMIRNRGGYVHMFLMTAQDTINTLRKEKQGSNAPITIGSIEQMTIGDNNKVTGTDNSIDNSSKTKTINNPPANSSTNWLQNLYWIIGIVVALTVLYTFGKSQQWW